MAVMWHYGEPEDGILRVSINCEDRPVNALSRAAMEELRELVEAVKANSQIRGVIFQSAKPGVFIAGADITEFEDLTEYAAAEEVSQFGQSVFAEVEQLGVPAIALISGACLGGGLEFALSCTYRIADDHEKTKLGLPEVQLGLLPGWGGTVRLPRLIGLIEALPLILSGQQLNGYRARSKGLVHEMVPREALVDVGNRVMATHLERGSALSLFRKSKKPGWQRAVENSGLVKKYAINKARREVLKKTHGHYPAPLQILDTVQNGVSAGESQRFRLESNGIAKLAGSPVTRECIRLFFLSENAKKPPQELTATFDAKELKQAAVLGAGAMGAGIALLLARKGIATRLKDIKPEFVARGVQTIRGLLQKDVKRKRLTPRQAEAIFDRISPTVDYRGLKHADIVIEAVLEEIDIKRQVFGELAEATSDETVLATNTSSLLVSDIARDVPHPERVVGLHFFNPPHQMPLVEIIHTPQTSPIALAKAFATVQRLGKTAVVAGDCAGFLVNRLLGPYMNEAGFLLVESANPLAMDKAAVNFGMPMGPLALSDLVGLDVAAHVAENLHTAYGDRMKPAPLWDALKEIRGSERKPKLLAADGKSLNNNVASIVSRLQREAGGSRSAVGEQEIIERLVYPIVNEGARCLAEGIARRSEDVDLAMVFGTGFAPFRGGPMRYAESVGLETVVKSLERMAQTHPHLAPSDSLRAFAHEGSFGSQTAGTHHEPDDVATKRRFAS
ncbi:fatty acid oxidation complex subunit alpha FadJ [bacterium]|nr:fatty acid oxidation complex subunit alpha FadJ [bacterium]